MPWGVNVPFLSASHWAAIFGNRLARSFSPGSTTLLAHTGHPAPPARENTDARHSWPFSHRHQTFLCVPANRSAGASVPFLAGCHCLTRSGQTVARSFSPGTNRRLAQTGQPAPFVRTFTAVCQECPLGQRHHTRFRLPLVRDRGVSGALRSVSHWSSRACAPSRRQKSYSVSPTSFPLPSLPRTGNSVVNAGAKERRFIFLNQMLHVCVQHK